MIRITFVTDQNAYVSVESAGHAGYGGEGEDILCAAVSALLINAVNSIEAFTSDRILCESDDGYLYFSFPEGHGKDTELLLRSLILGLTGIRDTYGDQYLSIVYEEVQNHVEYEPSDVRS